MPTQAELAFDKGAVVRRYSYTKTIPWKKRSAFGQGWETRREGFPVGCCEYPLSSVIRGWFRDGWVAFRDRELQDLRGEHCGETELRAQEQ